MNFARAQLFASSLLLRKWLW